MKLVIADPKQGNCYQIELDETKSKPFNGEKVGNELDGSLIGLTGYKMQITGGSDKDGFPMRRDFHGQTRKKLLIKKGAGVKKPDGQKHKKTIRGNTVAEDIAQINVKITKYGNKKVKELLGIETKEEKPEKEQKEEKPPEKTEPKKETPKQDKKPEPTKKPKTDKKEPEKEKIE